MSTIKVDAIQNTSGVEVYTAKAWVNFNGTTNAINGSANVSSITDNGSGDQTTNYSSALLSANYSVTTGTQGSTSGNHPATACSTYEYAPPTTTAVRVVTGPTGGSGVAGFLFDMVKVYVTITL